ncbi:hypothetical protein A9Q98_01010 [Thalassotalea sp. 42_200_T64]|nr:hypothetical protein A9Q98_01010 [Thalassotalea sp. 42_200_T64]
MAEIYFLLFAFLIVWYFISLRKIAERARALTTQHCEQQGLQFIAIARCKTGVGSSKRQGIFIKSVFEFEFSGDGESSYKGYLTMHGNKPVNFDLPAYKI